MWEGVGDRTELQHIDPQSIGHNRVSFPFSWAAQPGAWGPTLLGAAFSTTTCHQRVSKLTDFLSSPSYIIVPSPTQSLEWHVWSSSSGNNCHAVHRSLSSCASVYDCTMGFYLVPYCQPRPPTRFLPITAIGASLWNVMFGRVESQYTTMSRIFVQLFRFKLNLLAFRFAPARQKESHSFYSRGFW